MLSVFTISLIYLFLITITYFSKERVSNNDTKVYKWLIIVSITGVLIDIIQYILIKENFNSIIIKTFNKSFLVYINVWTLIFSKYIINIYNKNSKINNLLWYIAIIVFIIFSTLAILLPIDYTYIKNVGMYSHGPSADITYVAAGLYISIMIISLVLNFKSLDKKVKRKYIPLITFMVMGGLEAGLQMKWPTLTLLSPLEAFITILMYFTIENPDIKMIEKLKEARIAADQANQAKTEFLSSMSHEIRTPLNAIINFSNDLIDDGISEKAKEDVKYIVKSSESLLEIVNSILDISKIEANKLEIIRSDYSVKELFDELIAMSKVRIDDKPIEFRYNLSRNLPKVLYGDAIKVKQVCMNLLTNAIKYTEQGFVELNVNIEYNNNLPLLIVSVKDSGIGIKEEDINKIFNKFERLDIEKNISIEGTGLGLALTKKLVELNGGGITVESEYGKGSIFTVKIVQEPAKNIDIENIPKLRREQEREEFIGKRVLVVDDNKLNLKVAEKLLEQYKITGIYANSGIEAINMVKEHNDYDLVLMDDMMPNMSGVETFQELKKYNDFKTPVVALTANAISGMKEKYLGLGFDDYLAKPIDRKELKRVLNRFL